MLALTTMAVLVSLSDVFYPKEEDLTVVSDDLTSGKKMPVYIAVLSSLMVPFLFTGFVFVVKYADKTLRLVSTDFAVGYWLLVSVFLTILQIIHFSSSTESTFDWQFFQAGFLGSICALLGCTINIAAFATENAPYGPISALLNVQSIANIIIDMIRYGTVLSRIEYTGVAVGFLGALILTIPDQIYAFWYLLTRCRVFKEKQETDECTSELSDSLCNNDKRHDKTK